MILWVNEGSPIKSTITIANKKDDYPYLWIRKLILECSASCAEWRLDFDLSTKDHDDQTTAIFISHITKPPIP